VIALDTSSVVAFFAGEAGPDRIAVREAFIVGSAVFPSVVVTELLSHPAIRAEVLSAVASVPRLEVGEGYWERAGGLRARLLRLGLKARLADTLVAQSCLDHDVALITRDQDFRHFARHAGLRLSK
jgi:hypothetical protein